jgi:N-acetylmuramoyl-L-alanine amidase
MTSIVISSGHSKHVRGASSYLDEVNEARKVVREVATRLRERDVTVHTFHDDTSAKQRENLGAIIKYHNSQKRSLDVSVHFNAHHITSGPMGTEVLYLSQKELATKVSKAIADAGGFLNRGAKERTNLAFLNSTKEPAILIEVCFVDSAVDAQLYEDHFSAICEAIAGALV